ncbi:MAG TPA: electron transfer flavoprotein subunit alpha/FixB family protein [candidate division Zixibacteria bacterium]|nr:electron transfer flavoprotein subunit alpha/FixB family protein [candidate division Zixibacteria bacterium]
MSAGRDILVVAEHRGGRAETITYQMLAKGRSLADGLGARLSLLVAGCGTGPVAEGLSDKGADGILVVDDPALKDAGAELHAHVVCEVAARTRPCLILIGYSLAGMELAPAVAARLGSTAMTNCIDLQPRGGFVTVTRPLFDGTFHAEIALEEGELFVVALQKAPTPPVPPRARVAEIERVEIALDGVPRGGRTLEIVEEPAAEVDISRAEVIVSVGRGLGGREKIPIIEELAEALGGVMACSRPVVDVGWLPRDRQVGASGKSVAPKVYIACGISGASQHLSGMIESGRIIAINKDANAPIFQVAHYGVVGDLHEIVPALTKEAKKEAKR